MRVRPETVPEQQHNPRTDQQEGPPLLQLLQPRGVSDYEAAQSVKQEDETNQYQRRTRGRVLVRPVISLHGEPPVSGNLSGARDTVLLFFGEYGPNTGE